MRVFLTIFKFALPGVLLAAGMFTKNQAMAQIQPEKIEKIVDRSLSKFGLPSAAVVLISPDSLLHMEIQGVRRLNSEEDVSSKSFYHIGSCSKSVLAVIAAKLVEEHKIEWDSRFFEIVPELINSSLADYHEITLEDLFMCKAGIMGFTDGSDDFPSIDTTSSNARYEFMSWLVSQPPASKKANGKFGFSYSNAG